MRVLLDVPSAEFGGIRTYVENLLAAWATSHADDAVLVVLPRGSDLRTGAHARHELDARRPVAVTRPLLQTRELPALVRSFRADVVLSVAPTTSLRRLPVPHAVVVHDLRHELRPDQFSLGRRVLRKVSYDAAYRVADGYVAVSQRTLGDLHRLHPRLRGRPATVVHHGADHVRAWSDHSGTPTAVAFAHHSNKNPDLVLAAWRAGLDLGRPLPRLQILGTGGRAAALQERVDALGLGDEVTLLPYLEESAFRQVMGNAKLIVFPSDFEGFGLPVLESMMMGVPVVVGPEPALLEVAGGHAHVMSGWTPTGLVSAIEGALAADDTRRSAAQRHAQSFTWSRAVDQTRAFLAGLPRS